MIIADASWIIALRDGRDVHHERAVAIHESVGTERVLLPSLTFAECLVGPAKFGALDVAAHGLRAAFEIVEADVEAPLRWASLRADTGLRLPDVVVLDAAVRHGARAIATFDDRLAASATDRTVVALK